MTKIQVNVPTVAQQASSAYRSRIKCKVCRGCTTWIVLGPQRYTYCAFCEKYYKLLPGVQLEEITLENLIKIREKLLNELS